MVNQLTDVLQTYREGPCPVFVQYNSGKEHTRLSLGEGWKVHPSEELIIRLRHVFDDECVKVIY
jgi:DNA polymerase-3 subunit alpha